MENRQWLEAQAKAAELADVLSADGHQRVVLAESCTGGLASAVLTAIPGISRYYCGSSVTYREATKISWLQVSSQTLAEHTAVSESVAIEMAVGALRKTPEATSSGAITGHFGPDAPVDLDGVVFMAVARRFDEDLRSVACRCTRLTTSNRLDRQFEAAALLLQQLRLCLV